MESGTEAVRGSRKSKLKEAAINGNLHDHEMKFEEGIDSQINSGGRVLFILVLNKNVGGHFSGEGYYSNFSFLNMGHRVAHGLLNGSS